MRKFSLIAALLASTMLAGGAFAQDASNDMTPKIQDRVQPNAPASGSGASVGKNAPAEKSPGGAAGGEAEIAIRGSGAAEEWVGKPLVATDGNEVGTVREVIVDTDGAVREVHAEVGGFLGIFTDTVSIPVERIMREQDGRLLAEMSAAEIEAAPRVGG